ncbi:protein phosphatase 1 regulatory subunit 3C-B-like [Brachyistius frenatus]|uniref:protein phosphatase 1 regulatory subunit 3C-B-like n=1 Tax=Brachyistius frenatus TaxID=100188 RepID=UPI0037E9C7EC
MNCTRVLRVLQPVSGGPSPIRPVDVAVTICLASPPPRSVLYQYHYSSSAALLPHCRTLRPCLTFTDGSNVATAATTSTSSPAESSEVRKKKRSVVFADSRGLALAAIHIFNEAEDEALTELQFHLTEIEGAAAGPHPDHIRDSADCGSCLVLDFTQPAADYLDLRNRLKAQQVCLETCSIHERLLSGTVQVRNICFEKSVSVRITFDSWRSFQDIQCRYQNNVYGCPDTDTFSFSASVPEVLEPSHRVEFCIQYQTRAQTFWDNNHGNNYRLAAAGPNSCLSRRSERTTGLKVQRDHGGDKRDQTEFDPFGSPRTSDGFFTEWQRCSHIANSTPYW